MPLAVLLLLVLSLIYSPTSAKDNDTDNDPFHNIARFKLSKPARDTFCLPSDAPPELLSFEEWKAKQIQVIQQPVVVAAPVDSGTSPETAPLEPANNAANGQAVPKLVPHPLPSQGVHAIPLTNRFNYASSDCSARLHSASSASTNPHHILTFKKDKYLLAPCKTHKPKFVIVELCDDIQIDTVQLANYEFFSGVFKTLRIGVTRTLPVGNPDSWEGWTEMGTYEARNVRGIQTFHPPQDFRSFYRYIRIDFLSSYGNEYYCPLSVLRVYGLTQMEEWIWEAKEQTMKVASISAAAALSAEATAISESSTQPFPAAQDEASTDIGASQTTSRASPSAVSQPPTASTNSPVTTTSAPQVYPPQESARSVMDMSRIGGAGAGSMTPGLSSSTQQNGAESGSASGPDSGSSTVTPAADAMRSAISMPKDSSPPADEAEAELNGVPSVAHSNSSPSAGSSTQSSHTHETSQATSSGSAVPNSATIVDAPSSVSSQTPASPPGSNTPTSVAEDQHAKSTAVIVSAQSPAANVPPPSYVAAPTVQPILTLARTIGPGPSMGSTAGESVFRTLANRLTTLEVNTSLYSMYLEEQTRSIRTSLQRMEDHLSVVERDLRKVLLEGESEGGVLIGRAEWERERERERLVWEDTMLKYKQRIDKLAGEIRSEKRLGVAQLILLVLVLFFSGVNRWGLSMGVEPLQASSIVDQISDSLSVTERRRVTSLSSIFGRQIGHRSRLSQSNNSLAGSEISERSRAGSLVSRETSQQEVSSQVGPSALDFNGQKSPRVRPSPLHLNISNSTSESATEADGYKSGEQDPNYHRTYPASAGLVSSFPMHRSRGNTPNSTLRGLRPRTFHRTNSHTVIEILNPPERTDEQPSGSQWGTSSGFLLPGRSRRIGKMAHLHEVKPRNSRSSSKVRSSHKSGTMGDITNLKEGSSSQQVDQVPLENGAATSSNSQSHRAPRRSSTLLSSRHRRAKYSRPQSPVSRHDSARTDAATTSASRSTVAGSTLAAGDEDPWVDTDTQDTEPEQEYYQELEMPEDLRDCASSPTWNLDSPGRTAQAAISA